LHITNEFIEKVVVHERDQKGSCTTSQEVEIFFNFIGKYVPPHFGEVHLTAEEQEELRKQAEFRELRHQEYLKRKASGVQQRYDAKVKAKKKAEMDAKKNALRAEDMARGVFIPVNKLPKQEPKVVKRGDTALPTAANQ
jgi:hypothetical protein